MNKNKKIFLTLSLLALFNCSAIAQLAEIRTTMEYSPIIGKNEVTSASSVGGLVQLNFAVAQNFTMGISIGYKLYSLNQPDQLQLWNWDFWNLRYKPKIDSDLRADPNLSVELGSVQKMDLIPLMLNARYKIVLNESVTVTPNIGAGIMFFTRRMFAEETWSKKFKDADYVLTYTYRNFAPDKKGSPLAASAGLDLSYMLFKDIEITGGASFIYFIPTGESFGYNLLPLKHELSFNLGINFNY